ncbi:MAG: sulfatase-like hydrolase/transferase [Chthoniobacteraceae bacterium]
MRISIVLAAWLTLAVCAFSADQPNIVFVFTDDLGINDLSCYGRTDQQTPNLDRLAAEGMRFTDAYCSQPICSPSRAGLLTGKNPARLHLTNYLPGRPDAASQKVLQPVIEGQLPLEETTLAEVLRGAGYATACIGKWHLGGKGFGPKEQGFDYAFAGHANTKPTATEGSKGEYELTAEASRWMESVKDQPFFLYLAHNTVHIPFSARSEDAKQHDEAFNPDYAAVVAHMDACVGLTMKRVEELGLRDRTIFIFASDNGGLHVLEFRGNNPPTHNTPFRAGKGYVYEGGLRDPLIIRWPRKIAPGSVERTPVVFTDLMPTLLAAAGIDASKMVGPLDGVNLIPLLTGGTIEPRALFWHYPNYSNQGGRPAGAMREGDWKLVQQYEDDSVELYHLADDPGEAKDLAAKEPERAEAMRSKFAAWRKQIGVQDVRPNPDFDAGAHRALYVDRDPSKLAAAGKTSAQIEEEWADWREKMNAAIKGRKAVVTPSRGDVRLMAREAQVHAEGKLLYESAPHKNTIGYWTNPADWVSWDFETPQPGRYEVELLQGCGGEGGSEVAVKVAGQTLEFEVIPTGHFQNFISRTIGEVDLPAGSQTIAVKPKSKKGGAVMDLRRVVLRPIP